MQTITEKLEIEKMIHTFDANPLPTPCEAFAPSAALREKNNFREIFFLAKPQRSQRRSMDIFATTFHDLSFFSNNFPRLMLAIARTARGFMWWVRIDSRTD